MNLSPGIQNLVVSPIQIISNLKAFLFQIFDHAKDLFWDAL